MKRSQGRLQRKSITSLSMITTPIMFLAGILCFVVFQQELPYLFKHIASGSSFFVPSIPAINLFGFLPDHVPAPCFTIGNLVDVVIDFSIALSIGIIPYRWQKSVREPGIPFLDMRLYNRFDITKPRVKPCTSGSCPSQSLARRTEKGEMPLDLARSDGLSEGWSRTGASQVVVKGPRNHAVHGARLFEGLMAPGGRKVPMESIAALLVVFSSIPSFYSCSRTRERGARADRHLFLAKIETKSSNNNTEGWRRNDS